MLSSAVYNRYSAEAVGRALSLFETRRDWVHRVSETVEVVDTRLRRRVELSLTIPGLSGSDPVRAERTPIPLFNAMRGALLDNFDVFGADGRRLPVLSQVENKALAGVMLEARLTTLTDDVPLSTDSIAALFELQGVLRVLPTLEPAVAARLYDYVFEDKNTARFMSFIRTAAPLQKLADFFTEYFLITTEIIARPFDTTVISYEYDSPYEEPDPSTLRYRLGQRPYSFRVDVPLAFSAPSYHLRMAAPEGHYCRSQRFLGPGSNVPLPVGNPQPYIGWHPPDGVQSRRSSAEGLPYAHLYVHGLDEHPETPFSARIIFYERPPGSLGLSLVFALSTAIAMTVLCVAYYPVVRHSDLAALYLGLVGTAALWLRPTFDRANLLQAPLAARLGLITIGMTAAIASLQLIVAASLRPLSGWTFAAFQMFMIVWTTVSWAVVRRLFDDLRRSYTYAGARFLR